METDAELKANYQMAFEPGSPGHHSSSQHEYERTAETLWLRRFLYAYEVALVKGRLKNLLRAIVAHPAIGQCCVLVFMTARANQSRSSMSLMTVGAIKR